MPGGMTRAEVTEAIRAEGWEMRPGAGLRAERDLGDRIAAIAGSFRKSAQIVEIAPALTTQALSDLARRIARSRQAPILAAGPRRVVALEREGAAGLAEALREAVDWAIGIDLDEALERLAGDPPRAAEAQIAHLAALARLGRVAAVAGYLDLAEAEEPTGLAPEITLEMLTQAHLAALEAAEDMAPAAEVISLAEMRSRMGR